MSLDDTEARAALAGMVANNPALVALMQNKLNGLIGRSSGYIESLPAEVRTRVAGLKGVQKDHSKLESQFQEEVLELEKKYFKKFEPLYKKRAAIINGSLEPTEAEVEAGKADDEEDDDEDVKKEDEAPATSGEPVKGIPEFWLSSLKNNVSLQEMITDQDEAVLKQLTDIRMEYLDKPGFKLIFDFNDNEYFSNKTLTKTYYYREESGYGGDFIYDHAEGDKVEWKPNKDLTVRIESKKQRNKSEFTVVHSLLLAHSRLTYVLDTKQTRVIKKTVPCESFFNFFSPPSPPKEDVDTTSDIEERLELDYQLGEDIKEKIIPRAIDWFTGEALQYEQFDDFDGEDGFEDEDDDDDDDSEERDEDDDESDDDADAKPQKEAECKQS